jgi:hypothetical protein
MISKKQKKLYIFIIGIATFALVISSIGGSLLLLIN